jgi:hypothetical protein
LQICRIHNKINGQNTTHWVGFAIKPSQRTPKINQPAALTVNRHSKFGSTTQLRSQIDIIRKFAGETLRITAAKIYSSPYQAAACHL